MSHVGGIVGVEKPPGWVKRRSGIIVPGRQRRLRRAYAIVGILLALAAVASPIANAVSASSRAAGDVVTLIRTVIDGVSHDGPVDPGCVPPGG